MADIIDSLSAQNVTLAIGIVGLVQGAKQGLGDILDRSALAQRLVPVVPLLLGAIAGAAGIADAGAGADLVHRLVTGLAVGAASSQLWKLSATTILGQ